MALVLIKGIQIHSEGLFHPADSKQLYRLDPVGFKLFVRPRWRHSKRHRGGELRRPQSPGRRPR